MKTRKTQLVATYLEAVALAKKLCVVTGVPHEVEAMRCGQLIVSPKRWDGKMLASELAERTAAFNTADQYGVTGEKTREWDELLNNVRNEELLHAPTPEAVKQAAEKVYREFVTSDRKEAMTMARTLFGTVKNAPGGYYKVVWSEWVG